MAGQLATNEDAGQCKNMRMGDALLSACVGAVAWHLLAQP